MLPSAGSVTTMLEQVLQTGLIGVAMVGTVMLGGGSISMIYIYLLAFDSLKCMGHCNCEFIPATLFQLFPIAKYLLYTPSYVFSLSLSASKKRSPKYILPNFRTPKFSQMDPLLLLVLNCSDSVFFPSWIGSDPSFLFSCSVNFQHQLFCSSAIKMKNPTPT